MEQSHIRQGQCLNGRECCNNFFRVTLTVACNLNLKNYPLDFQECRIKLISCKSSGALKEYDFRMVCIDAYITSEVNVTWFNGKAIRSNPQIGLPEFHIISISEDYCNGTFDYTITEQHHRRGTGVQ